MTTTRCDIYARISDDSAGLAAGVQRQEADCRALAEARGWEIHRVLVDNDISAYGKKKRPGYAALVDDLTAGAVQAVVAYHPDRLTRRPRELEDLIDLLDSTKAKVATVAAGDYDLTTATGRMAARVVGAVARNESERISERVRRTNVDAAKAGRPTGGVRKFGHAVDGVTVVETEAAEIRAAYRRILDEGASVRSVASDWNARGIAGTQGRRWHAGNVRRLLISARVAGYREFGGALFEAQWPAVVDRDDWTRISAILTDPARQTPGRPVTHLLTGIAKCGKCGAGLQINGVSANTRSYRCPPSTGPRPGCGGVRRDQAKLDHYISEAVLGVLTGPGLAKGLREAAGDDERAREVSADLEKLSERLERLLDLAESGDITKDVYRRRSADIEATRVALQGELAARSTNRVLARLPVGPALRSWWAAETTTGEQKREVVASVLTHFIVMPSRRGDNRFQADRIEIPPEAWRI